MALVPRGTFVDGAPRFVSFFARCGVTFQVARRVHKGLIFRSTGSRSVPPGRGQVFRYSRAKDRAVAVLDQNRKSVKNLRRHVDPIIAENEFAHGQSIWSPASVISPGPLSVNTWPPLEMQEVIHSADEPIETAIGLLPKKEKPTSRASWNESVRQPARTQSRL